MMRTMGNSSVVLEGYPIPPFTLETALQKVQAAEDAWNTKNPPSVALAYSVDTEWRNRADFIKGRAQVKAFLTRKWEKEKHHKLKKELWGFAKIEWQYNFNMNGKMIPDNGFAVTEMSCRNLIPKVTCNNH